MCNTESKNTDELIDITKLAEDFVLDMRYASENNFAGKKVYPKAVCALKEGTAWKLVMANREFKKSGFKIKIWDAYRPHSVQKIFWDIVPDDRFVANPYTGGSIHSSGNAVDITLVDETGKELIMPTGFDDFSDKASRSSKVMSHEAEKNMKLLTDVMVKNGFKTIDSEWWHYEDTDSCKNKYTDVPLEEISSKLLPVEKLNCIGDSKQVMLVTNKDASSCKAKMNLFEKIDGKWKKVCHEMEADIGKNGFRPVKNSTLSEEDKKTYKHEGDGCTPMGAYTLDKLFGWGENPGFDLPYRKIDDFDFWTSENSSDSYNVWVRREEGPDPSWTNYEKLNIVPYKFAGIINYNIGDNKIIGNGSAIFLHLKTQSGYTAGCTAVSDKDLDFLFMWMKTNKKPLWVGGTEDKIFTL